MSQSSSARQQSVVITDARSGASKDHDQRVKRYAIAMGFRTACFIAMIFVPGVGKWVLLAFAIFLPGVAVLLANQANQRSGVKRETEPVEIEPLPQLTTGHYVTVEGETVEGETVGGETVEGEVLDPEPGPGGRTRAA